MSDIFSLLLPFFGMIFIGYVAARLIRQPAEAMGWLNVFILYAALPALFFKLIAKTPMEQLARMDFVGTSLLATYSIFALLFVVGVVIRKNSIAETTIQSFCGSYGNIGYMGPGLALLVFGEAAAVPVALIVCLENATHFIVAPAMMAIAGGDKRSPLKLAGDICKKVLTHPFILAVILGFIAAGTSWAPPEPLQRLIDYLAPTAAPCALFAMGVTLALRPIKRLSVEMCYIVPAKLILHPVVTYVFLTSFGTFDPIWVYSAVLLAGLPTAANVFVIAQQYQVWQERASASILISTVLSVVTLTGVLYVVRQLAG
ncbi:AEC family transporter [Agrobacterium sp.]|uniref:AEC family transporter n=1 Tax=Agrobacterium sp. TaxID=361 RepID=UPI0028A99EBC|nr:AEC family transporter [Agrobacterium sp.]